MKVSKPALVVCVTKNLMPETGMARQVPTSLLTLMASGNGHSGHEDLL